MSERAVTDNGALGDGLGDETAACQLTIDQVRADGGGIVRFPSGEYRLSAPLVIPNEVGLRGEGGLSTRLKAIGHHYCLRFDPGARSFVRDLFFTAAMPQAFGGAIDYRAAQMNVHVERCWFGINLHTGLLMASALPARGLYYVRQCRWTGAEGCTYGIVIGDGVNQVSGVELDHITCTAVTTTGMNTWVVIANQTDSVKLDQCCFYQGNTGIRVGDAVGGPCVGLSIAGGFIDGMASIGLDVVRSRDLTLQGTRLSANGIFGVRLQESKGAALVACTVQNTRKDGVVLTNASQWTRLLGNLISDNNTDNSPWSHGVTVAAGTTDFLITGNQIGNNLILTTGHQKYGIRVEPGASDRYVIAHNALTGNDTAGLSDGGTGTSKVVAQNLPAMVIS
jgi:Right handed beta helix region/Pectate lyase superfamily protein